MDALNVPNYGESLREAYGNKSMNTEIVKLNRSKHIEEESGEENDI